MRTQNPRFRLAATVAVTALLLSQVLPQPAMAQGAPPPLRPAGAQDQQGGDPPDAGGPAGPGQRHGFLPRPG